jgi:hypothetical protein
MSDKALVNVMIKNVVNGHRRVPSAVKTEKKPLAFTQPVAPTLKSVPHTPFFSHNDQTKEKKLNDEITDLKKTADRKDKESNEEKQNSLEIVKKDTDELKRIHDKELKEQKNSTQKHYRVLDELKTSIMQNNLNKIDDRVRTHNSQQQELHHRDIIQREMEHDASHRRKDKKHADQLRIVTEQIPPKKIAGEPIVTQTDVPLSEWGVTQWVYSSFMRKGNDDGIKGRVEKAYSTTHLAFLRRVTGETVRDAVLHFEKTGQTASSAVKSLHTEIHRRQEDNKDDSEAKEHKEEQDGDGEIHIGSGGIGVTNEGMNTSQIEDFLKNRTHHIIPCIAKDEMSTLLPYVHKGQKEFGFVRNTENHTQSGQHWKCCYINTETGECDYFDSLVSEPDKVFMKGITEIIRKIDPPIYLKLKINRVKIQSNTSANCGEFCCQFLDKMFHGGAFRQATFYDTINGEKMLTNTSPSGDSFSSGADNKVMTGGNTTYGSRFHFGHSGFSFFINSGAHNEVILRSSAMTGGNTK